MMYVEMEWYAFGGGGVQGERADVRRGYLANERRTEQHVVASVCFCVLFIIKERKRCEWRQGGQME